MSFGDKKYPVILKVEYEKLCISCQTEIGEIFDEIIVETDGRKMFIGFNPNYLIECLRAIEDEQIEMFFATDLGPVTIKPVYAADFTYVIGAIRIPR